MHCSLDCRSSLHESMRSSGSLSSRHQDDTNNTKKFVWIWKSWCTRKVRKSETIWVSPQTDLLVLEVWDLQVVTTELEPCFHKLCGGGHAPAPSLLSTQSPLLPRTHTKAEITKDPLKAKTLNPRESVSRHPEQGCDCVFPKLNL